MKQDIYTLGDLERLIGATRSQLTHWTQSQLLVPSVQRAQGPGTRQLFSWGDLCVCGLLTLLNNAGLRADAMREIVRRANTKYSWPQPPPKEGAATADVFLLSDDQGIRIGRGTSFEALINGKAAVLGVNLDALQRELVKRVQRATGRRRRQRVRAT